MREGRARGLTPQRGPLHRGVTSALAGRAANWRLSSEQLAPPSEPRIILSSHAQVGWPATIARRKLAHVVVLANGSKLVTLRDAANLLLEVRFDALDYAVRQLLKAAESGKRTDIVEATASLERVLRTRRLL